MEKGKGELSGKLENQKEMAISKMAEIEVLKEWDKVSIAPARLSAVYFHVELSKMSEEEAVEGEGLLSRVGAACWRMSAVRSGKRVVRGLSCCHGGGGGPGGLPAGLPDPAAGHGEPRAVPQHVHTERARAFSPVAQFWGY